MLWIIGIDDMAHTLGFVSNKPIYKPLSREIRILPALTSIITMNTQGGMTVIGAEKKENEASHAACLFYSPYCFFYSMLWEILIQAISNQF
jgi:hypothetical protein